MFDISSMRESALNNHDNMKVRCMCLPHVPPCGGSLSSPFYFPPPYVVGYLDLPVGGGGACLLGILGSISFSLFPGACWTVRFCEEFAYFFFRNLGKKILQWWRHH